MELFEFGRWIYFDKVTGEILHNTGITQHTDPDYENKRDPFSYAEKLMDRDPSSVGIIKLKPRELEQDFDEGYLARVNPDTLGLEFVYLDPANPEVPQEPRKPLSVEVDELNTTMGTLLLESANDKATIASLEDTVGSLLLEVAALKGGAV
ncbi:MULTISPECIES: hypothetical protein [Paenibacillus]|jgi:hypothetical protein|uniref:hypothetical protein n=1 Tax=Paenibacillus TaxID=44249 RepID=UPI00240D9448|nr:MULTISPECIES: hypothetical protein [Paenibacillus]MCI1776587.1 hypothetical protein [Paenibacillus lautus]WFB57584.1 hypothetical protein P0X86_27055 [Paenibacillus sp. BR1-192]